MTLKSLIVDDEASSRELLHAMLKEHCPQVKVIGEAEDITQAGNLISRMQPDLVFLDIQLRGSNGFDLLAGIQGKRAFHTVFVTAFNQFALRAIKAGAADYILKPVDQEELQQVVEKIYEREMRARKDPSRPSPDTLLLPHARGFRVVQSRQIVHLKADNNYTDLYMEDKSRIVVSKPIRDFEHKLDERFFLRVHKSHIINFLHFREYLSEDGTGYALMSDGSRVAISRLKLGEFIEFSNRFAAEV